MKLAVALVVCLAGCATSNFGEVYVIDPKVQTIELTRVLGTPEEIRGFCRVIGQDTPACTIWSGSRSVMFIPAPVPALTQGHELEHAFSGNFHP